MKRFIGVILSAILAILTVSFYFIPATWHIWVAALMISAIAFVAYRQGRRSGLRSALSVLEDEVSPGD